MAAQWPVLSNRDQKRTKNKNAVDEAVSLVYETVIAWGCKKEEHESFTDYHNRRPEMLWNDNKEKWKEEAEKKLENHTKEGPEENNNKKINREVLE